MTTVSNLKVSRTIPLLLIVALFCPLAHAETVQWPVSAGGNGHIYEVMIVPEGIIWVDANSLAEQNGGHLATITSQDENDFVFSLINDGQYWNGSGGPLLGGYQLPGSVEPNGGWVWVTGEPFVYSNWGSGQPNNNGNENCIHFGWGGISPKWNDLEDIYTAYSIPIAYVVEFSHRIVYVDDDAAGASDGTSWTDAYVFLQDALAAARSGDEIRVAKGIHKPDQHFVKVRFAGVQVSGDRAATFQLINWVTIKGGYAGSGEPDPDVRDVDLFETILSGDLNGDDAPGFTNSAENSYHIVTGSGTDQTAVLDGFIITAGNANGPALYDRGSGMLNDQGSPTVTNCTFIENFSDSGGAMYNDNSSPTLDNCMFSGNAADKGGGAMTNWQSSTTLTNCTFNNNSAGWGGGAIDNHNNLTENSPTLINCTFFGNSGGLDGGGMFNDCSSPTLTNCIFSCNYANRGGGIENREASNPILINCTFSGNLTGWSGGGISNFLGSNPILTNCIVWGDTPQNTSQIDNDDTCSATITYSDVQGGWPGQGNINANPHFASLGYWVAPSPRTGDVLWIAGDCHLKSEAGRWDPNSESWIQDDVTSPCIDAGDPNSPIDIEPSPNGGIINMGAYGGTDEASKSIYGLHTKYSGGTGRQNEPFQIATAEDLMLLSESPGDFKKHFILTADIDLDPNLPGRKVFDRAVIAPDMNDVEEGIQGAFFTGTFDGNDHTISHLTIKGDSFLGLFGAVFGEGIAGAMISNLCLEAVDVNGAGDFVGGLVGYNIGSSIITTYSTGTVIGEECVGGVLGYNTAIFDDGMMNYSTIESCYSSVDVSGVDCVGGLVGTNLYGTITNCYATGSVVASPINWWLPGGVGGGLVGENWQTISNCYATGRVLASGTNWSPGVGGGLVGENNGEVMYSFWDTQTSGQAVSGGGTPKTTSEMQTASTFLNTGWDFVDETANGTEDIWWILEGRGGRDYPRLWWELLE